jgi:hypothetical protein
MRRRELMLAACVTVVVIVFWFVFSVRSAELGTAPQSALPGLLEKTAL